MLPHSCRKAAVRKALQMQESDRWRSVRQYQNTETRKKRSAFRPIRVIHFAGLKISGAAVSNHCFTLSAASRASRASCNDGI